MAERDLITTRGAEFHQVSPTDLALLSVNSGVPIQPAMWEAILLMEQGISVLDGLTADLESSDEREVMKVMAARFLLLSSKAIFEAVHGAMPRPSAREAA